MLRGRVVDREGRAIEGAGISFRYSGPNEMREPPIPWWTSGRDGSFEVPCMAGVPTLLRARSPDDARLAAEQRLIPIPGDNPLLELVLRPSASLAVDVVDPSGTPLADLRVTAVIEAQYMAPVASDGVTDGMGHIDLDLGSSEGTLFLTVRDVKSSFALPQQVIRVAQERPSSLRVEFAPAAPAAIAGVVQSVSWSLPSDLTLELTHIAASMGASIPLGNSGTPFLIEWLPPAAYEVYLTGGEALGLALGSIDLVPGEQLDLGSITLPAPGSISFDWRPFERSNANSPEPAPVARIHVHDAKGWRIWTAVELREVPLELLPGDYFLRVERMDASTRDWPFHVTSREERWLVVEL